MIEKIKADYAGYKAAEKAIEATRPKELNFFNENMRLYKTNTIPQDEQCGVRITYEPGNSRIHIATVGNQNGSMYVDLKNVNGIIEGLTLFLSGDINDLPTGWYKDTK